MSGGSGRGGDTSPPRTSTSSPGSSRAPWRGGRGDGRRSTRCCPRGARRSGRACRSRSSACRPPGRGSAAARISSGSPRSGCRASARRRTRDSSTCFADTWRRSDRRRWRTRPPGPAWHGPPSSPSPSGCACVAPRRGRQGAPRPGACPAAPGGRRRARPLPRALGCRTPRARAPRADPARAFPRAGLLHEGAAVDGDVPSSTARWQARGGSNATRRRRHSGSTRSSGSPRCPRRAPRGGRAPRPLPRARRDVVRGPLSAVETGRSGVEERQLGLALAAQRVEVDLDAAETARLAKRPRLRLDV